MYTERVKSHIEKMSHRAQARGESLLVNVCFEGPMEFTEVESGRNSLTIRYQDQGCDCANQISEEDLRGFHLSADKLSGTDSDGEPFEIFTGTPVIYITDEYLDNLRAKRPIPPSIDKTGHTFKRGDLVRVNKSVPCLANGWQLTDDIVAEIWDVEEGLNDDSEPWLVLEYSIADCDVIYVLPSNVDLIRKSYLKD